MAQRLGADLVVNVETEDMLERVGGVTDSQGADVFLECAGAPPAVRLGLRGDAPGGPVYPGGPLSWTL